MTTSPRNASPTRSRSALILHPEAKRLLEGHYPPGAVNEARMRMAYVPDGAVLLPNPISRAPGFRIDNVYVMAGVPQIMQATFNELSHRLEGGAKMLSRSGQLQPRRRRAGARISANCRRAMTTSRSAPTPISAAPISA